AAGVGDDRQERMALARQQERAGGEVDVALGPDGVGGAVALVEIAGVVEHGVDGLVPLEVDDAEDLAALDLVGPAPPRRQDVVEDRLLRIEGALLEAHRLISTA